MSDFERLAYADSTALISLARIRRLDLLGTLYTPPILVTRHVWIEVARSRSRPGTPALIAPREQGLLKVVDEGDPLQYPTLDAGESSVLSAAITARTYVILDERKARRLIETDDELRRSLAGVTGVLGLVLLAKDEGHMSSV